jgi:4-amino-4-deoxy-L-arabinose transferase-like glycosyltransferase
MIAENAAEREWGPLLRRTAAVGGVSLALLVGWLAQQRDEASDFSGLLWLWLIGIAWFLVSCVSPSLIEGVWQRVRRFGHDGRAELAGLAALLLVALLVRAVDLEHIPANLGGDEGEFGLEALAMVDGRLANPFTTRWFFFPSMSFLAWGLSMRVLGDSVAGVRGLSAFIGTASVLTTFLLARELWGRRVGWLAAGLLASGTLHLQYSRLAVNNIADSLLVTLSLWLLARGIRKAQAIHFALAGTVIGVGWYGYFGARLIGIIAAAYVAGRVIAERGFLARHGRMLLTMLVAVVIVVAPLLFHYLESPGAFWGRYQQVSIFGSGWLAREQVITGRTATDLILQQFWRSFSAFNYTLDPTFWIRDTIPLLDFVSGLLFVIGLLWATAHWLRSANGVLLVWFWLALILGSVMTENPPSNPRMVIIAPALAVLAALGLDWLARVSRRAFGGGRRLWWSLAAAAVVPR